MIVNSVIGHYLCYNQHIANHDGENRRKSNHAEGSLWKFSTWHRKWLFFCLWSCYVICAIDRKVNNSNKILYRLVDSNLAIDVLCWYHFQPYIPTNTKLVDHFNWLLFWERERERKKERKQEKYVKNTSIIIINTRVH